MPKNEPTWCEACRAFDWNDEHLCIPYDPNSPCPECGEGTVYAFAGAPGIGGARVCRNNHHSDSTIRELSPEDVI